MHFYSHSCLYLKMERREIKLEQQKAWTALTYMGLRRAHRSIPKVSSSFWTELLVLLEVVSRHHSKAHRVGCWPSTTWKRPTEFPKKALHHEEENCIVTYWVLGCGIGKLRNLFPKSKFTSWNRNPLLCLTQNAMFITCSVLNTTTIQP